MAKKDYSDWTIRAFGVTFENGVRKEKPFEEFTEAEKNEFRVRKNREALAAAGYIPVSEQTVTAAI